MEVFLLTRYQWTHTLSSFPSSEKKRRGGVDEEGLDRLKSPSAQEIPTESLCRIHKDFILGVFERIFSYLKKKEHFIIVINIINLARVFYFGALFNCLPHPHPTTITTTRKNRFQPILAFCVKTKKLYPLELCNINCVGNSSIHVVSRQRVVWEGNE